MRPGWGAFVERVLDTGQWFECGARVEFFEARENRLHKVLEPAALGSYEVLKCEHLPADDGRWLAVTLRPFSLPASARRTR